MLPQATNRPADWGRRRFESQDWTERRYVSGGDQVVLTVVRSFDLKALYHHPELAVAYGADFEPSRVQSFEVAAGRARLRARAED